MKYNYWVRNCLFLCFKSILKIIIFLFKINIFKIFLEQFDSLIVNIIFKK
jgi:hypothetical protein